MISQRSSFTAGTDTEALEHPDAISFNTALQVSDRLGDSFICMTMIKLTFFMPLCPLLFPPACGFPLPVRE